jgi:hypothetical protein
MTSRILTLRNIRRLYAVFFLALFVVLLWLTSFKHIKGYETPLFLNSIPYRSRLLSYQLDLYKGLGLSLFIIGTLFLGRFLLWICPLGIINQAVGSILTNCGQRTLSFLILTVSSSGLSIISWPYFLSRLPSGRFR